MFLRIYDKIGFVRSDELIKLLRFFALLILSIALFYVTNLFALKGMDEAYLIVPNMSIETPSELRAGLNEEDTMPIIENDIITLLNSPRFVEGVVYLPIDFVKTDFNDEFYWDPVEKVLTYTTIKDVIRMKTDDLTYFVNEEPMTLSIPIRELVENVPYMPLELVKKFSHHDFYYDLELNTLTIDDLSLDSTYGILNDKDFEYGVIRTWKDRVSPIVKKIAPGESVKIYGDDGIWAEVRTKEGLIGYIKVDELGQEIVVEGVPIVREIYDYGTRPTFEGDLNLAWHQVSNTTANKYLEDKLEGVHGLNVISPTWFHIKDAEGNLTNLADVNYVNIAHAKGIQVWALFSNQFDSALTHEVLSSTRKRENLIKELLILSAIYDIDGINVDFEEVAKEDGPYFVQFMKELTPYLKNQGLVVSVDMYVPKPWTAHYGREEVGAIVDYVMIMAYDEHWSTSPNSGSVASIGFVEQGIIDTLKEVPKEKTVLGLPYYTRLWVETPEDGQIDVKSKAYGMVEGYDYMMAENVEWLWLEDIKQYYSSYEKDGNTYKMWLEDERSIEEKMKLYEAYDLAGVAGWKVGMENDKTWDVLKAYLKD
jgi:spore germination protein YaaH